MRTMLTWMMAIAGCAGLFSPGDDRGVMGGFLCEGEQVSDPTQVAPHRLFPQTDVLICLDASGMPQGSHIERLGESTLAEGIWRDGRREGVWTIWRPDGAFYSSTTWKNGKEHGPLVVASEDGVLVEIEMEEGAAISFQTNTTGRPMPEWEAGEKVSGTKYTRRTPEP